MKSFLKFCGIGCGVLILAIVGVLVFLGFKGFNFGRKDKGVEIRGYESKITGTSDVLEFQNIGYAHKISGDTTVNFSGSAGSMVFENVSVNDGNKTVILYSSGSSMTFSVTGSLGLRSEDLFLRDSATGKLSSFTHAKPAATVDTTANPTPALAKASDALFNNFSIDTTDLSGKVSFAGSAAVLSNPAGQNNSTQSVNGVEFEFTPSTRVFVVDNAHLMLPSALTLNSKDDDSFFSNLAFFTGSVEISGLNVNESATKANLTSRGKKITNGAVTKEGTTWKVNLGQEAFQVIVNDKVLIPAALYAEPSDAKIELSGESGGGSVNVKLSETSGRGDAILKEVKVEGPAKDWINLPKTKGIFGPAFEQLPDEAKPFFILPTIFGVIFVDTFLAIFQPDPLPDAILAGSSFTLEVGAYPPSEGAAPPSDPTATITLIGKNYEQVIVKLTLER